MSVFSVFVSIHSIVSVSIAGACVTPHYKIREGAVLLGLCIVAEGENGMDAGHQVGAAKLTTNYPRHVQVCNRWSYLAFRSAKRLSSVPAHPRVCVAARCVWIPEATTMPSSWPCLSQPTSSFPRCSPRTISATFVESAAASLE